MTGKLLFTNNIVSASDNSSMEPKINVCSTNMVVHMKLDQNQDDSLIAEETEEEKSPLERIRDFLISLVGQFKIYDKDTKIISWKNAGNFTYMNTDDFPTDIAEIAT